MQDFSRQWLVATSRCANIQLGSLFSWDSPAIGLRPVAKLVRNEELDRRTCGTDESAVSILNVTWSTSRPSVFGYRLLSIYWPLVSPDAYRLIIMSTNVRLQLTQRRWGEGDQYSGIKHWCSSSATLDPLQEIILDVWRQVFYCNPRFLMIMSDSESSKMSWGELCPVLFQAVSHQSYRSSECILGIPIRWHCCRETAKDRTWMLILPILYWFPFEHPCNCCPNMSPSPFFPKIRLSRRFSLLHLLHLFQLRSNETCSCSWGWQHSGLCTASCFIRMQSVLRMILVTNCPLCILSSLCLFPMLRHFCLEYIYSI